MNPQENPQESIPLQRINEGDEGESVERGVQTEWGSLDEEGTEANWGTEGQGEVESEGIGNQDQPEATSENESSGPEVTRNVINGGGNVNEESEDSWLVVGVQPVPGVVSVLISGVNPGATTRPIPKVAEIRIRDSYANDFYNQYCFFAQMRDLWSWQPKRNNLLIQFLKNLKLPGFKDGAKDNIHISTRVSYWTLAMACLIFGIWWSFSLVDDNNKNPTTTTRNKKQVTANNTMLFSHVGCNNCNFKSSQLENALTIKNELEDLPYGETYNYNDVDWDMTAITILLLTIYQMCYPKTALGRAFPSIIMQKIKRVAETREVIFNNRPDHNVYKNMVIPFIKEGQFTIEETIFSCFLFGRRVECAEIFFQVQTEMGTCFAFNPMPYIIKYKQTNTLSGVLNQRNISAEEIAKWENNRLDDFDFETGKSSKAFPGKRNASSIPLFQPAAGFQYGLVYSLVVRNASECACCQRSTQGFTTATYSPSEEPNLLNKGTAVSFNTENFIKVYPQITTSDIAIKEIEIDTRQCVYENETHLKYFNFYSQTNCIEECKAMAIMKKCGCSIFSLPSELGDTLCRPSDYDCVEKAEIFLFSGGEGCGHCLPGCNQMILHTSVSVRHYDPGNPPEHVKQIVGLNVNTAIVNVAYVENQVPAYKTALRVTKFELMSQIAGALGSTSGWCFVDVGRIMEALLILIFGITMAYFLYKRHLLMVEQFRRLESEGPRAQATLAIIESMIAREEILQRRDSRQCHCRCQTDQPTRVEQQARTTTTTATQTPKIVASKYVQFPELIPNEADGASQSAMSPIARVPEEQPQNQETQDGIENLNDITDENLDDQIREILNDKTDNDETLDNETENLDYLIQEILEDEIDRDETDDNPETKVGPFEVNEPEEENENDEIPSAGPQTPQNSGPTNPGRGRTARVAFVLRRGYRHKGKTYKLKAILKPQIRKRKT